MTPEELIAWHAHQIAFLPETDNVMVQHHREAMRCVERLLALLLEAQDAIPNYIDGGNDDLFDRIDAALAKEKP